MYPQIIIKHNVSYETVTSSFIDKAKGGFLGGLTKKFLERRLYFKHLRKRYDKNIKNGCGANSVNLPLKKYWFASMVIVNYNY